MTPVDFGATIDCFNGRHVQEADCPAGLLTHQGAAIHPPSATVHQCA